MHSLVKIPTARGLTVQITDSQYNYEPDYDNLTVKLGLCSREIMNFKINDKKRLRNNNKIEERSRIQELLKHDNIEVKLPTITLKAGKIILSLPFEIKNTISSKRPYNPQIVRDENISVRVDLGLKHFAVVSVVHDNYNEDPNQKGNGMPKEIARYFIGQKQIFDQKFVDGKFIFQQDKKRSNVMLKVRGIRNEIKRVQTQLANYKRAHPHDFRKKYKHYRLRNQLKTLWNRVNNINKTIKDKTSQFLGAIANHHHAKYIYFEDLRWSSHGKKPQVGKYLSFMQFHWLHSQVQEQVIHRGRIEGLNVKRVNAAYTSQRCSECGLIEYKDVLGKYVYLKDGLTKDEQKELHLLRTSSRRGKLFKCHNTKMHPNGNVFQLDSDLNASRNVHS